MKVKVSVVINASKEQVWSVISNIENSVNVVSGIEKVEVHNKPENGLVDFKWTETRTLFGKTATETMWITEAEENKFYKTRAESHGAIYISTVSIEELSDGVELSMGFSSKSVSFGAKLMATLLGFMFVGATKKALQQDLEDIKAAVET